MARIIPLGKLVKVSVDEYGRISVDRSSLASELEGLDLVVRVEETEHSFLILLSDGATTVYVMGSRQHYNMVIVVEHMPYTGATHYHLLPLKKALENIAVEVSDEGIPVIQLR